PAPDIPARLVPLSPPTRPPSPSPSLASFSWHAAPRALPSFPTRRSSDLRLDAQPRRASAGDHPVLCGQCRSATTGLAGAPEPSGDRKSTRLNSSHVKISYAVFCLKKKTHTPGVGIGTTQTKRYATSMDCT